MGVGGPNPNAWRGWYRGGGCTYGTWLRGDPRGFRTFRHREHVEGDYRNPPPPPEAGVWAPVFERSKRTMRWPAVELSAAARDILCRALVDQLRALEVEVIALAVAVNHFHLLARYPLLDAETLRTFGKSILRDGRDPAPRHLLGLARREASWKLAEAGLKGESPVWGVRPRFEPVRGRGHQVNTAGYIKGHVQVGAAVWCLGEFSAAWG